MNDPRLEDLVEIYASAGALEADRIVLLLEDAGIDAIARESTMSSFPSPAEASHLILVREPQKAQARALLESARRAGAIGETGAFL